MICGAVPVRKPADVYRALDSPAPCLELRLDYLESSLAEAKPALEEAVARRTVILTVRRREEGGAWRGTEEERAALYLKLLELTPHFVDVEAAAPAAGQVAAARGRTKLIASRHDFGGTPPYETLLSWAREAAALGDVVKIVTYAREPRDGLAVLSLIGAVEKPTVAFAMGPAGAYTRLAAAALGSPIMYVSLGEATAPGQISLDAYYAALLGMGAAPGGEGLPALREALDWIDGALMHLLKRRLEVCRDMGKIKKSAGLPIYDDIREAQVLKRAGDFKQIFELVVQMCKAVQLVA
ncbi:chorismate mutase [Pyrobaculum neutrophilum]|uniref:3-dehydroquinate dehydratase n=1 Tax=Pyrobaculum neutrophilum (strain DSM 2338 / JCM 9278 / NBRC 100436 / V24Sta) TaxID=444157 RepID=B1YD84_PYRNV|nr:chorismate mutase [Pyrobaculum neutrophilum]ACB39747.1 3-dehydroquinate dehydratase, type I [Pyrobaculum neutrophilum V24Sta]